MKIDLVKNKSMASSFETKLIDLIIDSKQNFGKKLFAKSIETKWTDVNGELNGNIEIYFADSSNSKALACGFGIKNTNNESNTEYLILNSLSDYLIIKYIKNGITSGKITISLNYN